MVIVVILIPFTIFAGVTWLQDQKYLFISLLVLIEGMLPFFMLFEGHKPQARELVLIAVLCALTVAGRSVFAALPQVKPVLALVIICGAALGGETRQVVSACLPASSFEEGVCCAAEAPFACLALWRQSLSTAVS